MTAETFQQSRPKALTSTRAVRTFKRTLLYTLLIVGAVLVCFPFLWMIITSFKTYAEAIAAPPTLFPRDWGSRLLVLAKTVLMYPLLIVILALWMTLGVVIARRIRDKVIAGIYVAAHLALFFVLGNVNALGHNRLADLSQAAMASVGLKLAPFFGNYTEAWGRAPFAFYFRNSIIISVVTPVLIIFTSAPAAYAFARLRFPLKDLFFLLYLATMMVPSEVLLIPNFITITELHWKNTYAALIVPFIVNVISIFFLRQFFASVPNDLYDAATIDGCGHIRFLVSIAIPLSRPALVSTTMFNFLATWNALLWPLLVTDKESMRPIALGLASFSTEAGTQPQLYMAAATFTIIPVIILFLFVQKQFIEGIARTGIK
jgi:ABC-type glycerol-3-phosphate transport system permease component